MKKIEMIGLIVFFFTGFSLSTAFAADKATPEEVYEMIVKAVNVVQELGDEGLEAFNDPKGEFVWKDTYVFVIDCGEMKILAHPKAKRIGKDIKNNQDKNPDPAKKIYHNRTMCEIANNPNGGWISYYWPKLGQDTASRKISFVLKAPGTNYVLVAGIYNDDADVEALNKQLQ